jgi:hypothetical protein
MALDASESASALRRETTVQMAVIFAFRRYSNEKWRDPTMLNKEKDERKPAEKKQVFVSGKYANKQGYKLSKHYEEIILPEPDRDKGNKK